MNDLHEGMNDLQVHFHLYTLVGDCSLFIKPCLYSWLVETSAALALNKCKMLKIVIQTSIRIQKDLPLA